MTTIKTAISIQKSIYEQAIILANKLNISRSRLFVIAVEDYIERYQNQALLEEINQAYADEPDQAETSRIAKMRKEHRNIVKGEW